MPSIALHINVTVQRLFSEVPASARRQPNCASAELPFLRSRLPAYTVEYWSFPQPLSGAVLFEPNYRTLFFRCQYLFCTFNTFARIFRGELRLYLYDYYRCPVSILRRKPELPRSVWVGRVVVCYRLPVSKPRKKPPLPRSVWVGWAECPLKSVREAHTIIIHHSLFTINCL